MRVSSCLSCLILTAALSGGEGVAQAHADRSIELVLVQSIPIDNGRAISGVAAGPNQSVIAWNTADGWLSVLGSSGGTRTVRQGLLIAPVSAALINPFVIGVVQADRRVLLLDASLRVLGDDHLAVPLDSLQAAVYHRGRWYAGGWAQDGSWVVHANGQPHPIIRLAGAIARPFGARLSCSPNSVIATTVGPPYHAEGVRADGDLIRLDRVAAVAAEAEDHTWFSMPALQVGPGWLQVIFDSRSDDRLFAAFDENGRLVRSTRVSVAVDLFAADSAGGRLLGMRDVGALNRELVAYEWRWRTGEEHSPRTRRYRWPG